MAKPEPTHTLVISIDGLRASALGAYGAAAYETPHLDALATESCVWDWCFADTPDLTGLGAALSSGIDPETIPSNALVVSDCDSFLKTALAESFSQKQLIETVEPSACAPSISETCQAQVWEEFASVIVSKLQSNPDERVFGWLHTRGMYGPWDAPVDLHEALLDEDDPPVPGEVAPPDATFSDQAELCEARFAASCRYAGQVMALDACLGGWLEIVRGLFEGQTLRIVLLGLRGFPLGEHGRIGGVDDRLFSEQQHVPLLVGAVDPNERFTREHATVTLSDAVARLFSSSEPSRQALLRSPSGAVAVHDGQWMLRQRAADQAESLELYSKPDDRWEQNDVAQLERETVESLAALLAPAAEDRA